MNQFKRLTASLLICSTTLLGMPLAAHAGIVSSADVLASQGQTDARAKVNAVLAREDVRAGLAERGLSTEQAQARVQAMSDEEVAQLAGRIDQAPAGGDILGVAFTIFIILLITDILGLTKVFPFTRAVR
ncbi:PA2779 family protein [Rhodoferax sp. GW822-FHT02A01]|uniref:PA2779 family protein n=1 Tax=Rhodoferax sp. GW822-FHT02A01 TaxID=3141537 RepID=UPI00315D0FD8